MRRYTYTVEQLIMLHGVLDFTLGADNVSITDSIVAMSDAINFLKTRVTDLDKKMDFYTKFILGLAVEKAKARKGLALVTATVMSNVRSYAVTNGNANLAAQMKTTLSKVELMPYKRILKFVNDAIDAVQPIVGSLADYDVTPAVMTNWIALRDNLVTWTGTPRAAIKTRKGYGEVIDQEMTDTMEFVRDTIDPLTLNFINTQPTYYTGYWASRKIDAMGVHHTRFNALVVNELGQPMWNITVTVDGVTHTAKDGKKTTYEPVSVITGIDGRALANIFFACDRTVTVSGPGIVTKTFGPYPFVHGETISQTLTVQPAFENLPEPNNTTDTPSETKTEINN